LIPNPVYDAALRFLPIPPVPIGRISLTEKPDQLLGQILLVPLSGRQMLTLPRPFVVKKVQQAVDKAIELGAGLVGLGALTAPVTTGGERLAHRQDVGVTNGNALTAAMAYEALVTLLDLCPASDPVVAVVGASGSVGTCLCRLIARRQPDLHLLMVARDPVRLSAAANLVQQERPGVRLQLATDMSRLRKADLIILLTASAESLLHSEHLKERAIVLDDTQPRNTDPSLLSERPDILLVDGGLVQVEGIQLDINLGFPRGCFPACLAETVLLGLEGHKGHFSIGAPTVEQAE
jgi:fatty aldehyde-generating acyl-ACP reductase